MLDRLTIERMAAVSGEGPIVVALSGGGDSTALLHLLVAHFGAARLRAGVVDHALRAGSADDANRAAQSAAALGVGARVLTLAWASDDKRSQARARDGRYRALAAFAREVGARVIAAGHNRDDQAETLLMRAAREPGWRALACMRPFASLPVWPHGRGLWLARPLLGARRAALRDMLQTRGAGWIEDPANVNPDFERVKARAALAREAAAGFDPMRLAAIAERIAPHAAALDRRAAALIEQAGRFQDEVISLNIAAWVECESVRERALAVLLAASGGQTTAPSPAQVGALAAQIASPTFAGATLGGARLKARGDEILITRDPGALVGRADGAAPVPPLALAANVETIWDNRVLLTAPENGWSVVYETGAPRLARGEARADLAIAAPHWLLKERVQHLLGQD